MTLILIPGLSDFTFLDFLDILLVSILLYQLYQLVKGTMAINILIGIIAIFIIWKVVEVLKMQLLSEILGRFIGVGSIALIIVFQQELRRFLLFIGSSGMINKEYFGKGLFALSRRPAGTADIAPIVKACRNMGESRTGAIIVITTGNDLSFYASTGEVVDARVTARLLESIFFKNNPLHDGAVIITNNRIRSARCVLPVTEDPEFPSHLGMRHRAAAGITESSDAIAVIVSEQTGEVAIASSGKLEMALSSEQLRLRLEKLLENN